MSVLGCGFGPREDASLLATKTYQLQACVGLQLSGKPGTRLSPLDLRSLFYCVDPTNELGVQSVLSLLTDAEIEGVLIQPLYEEVFQNPRRFYEISATYAQMKSQGLLASLMGHFGAGLKGGLKLAAYFDPDQLSRLFFQHGEPLVKGLGTIFRLNPDHPFLEFQAATFQRAGSVADPVKMLLRLVSKASHRAVLLTGLQRFADTVQRPTNKLEQLADSFMNFYSQLAHDGSQQTKNLRPSGNPLPKLPTKSVIDSLNNILTALVGLHQRVPLTAFWDRAIGFFWTHLERPEGVEQIAQWVEMFSKVPFQAQFPQKVPLSEDAFFAKMDDQLYEQDQDPHKNRQNFQGSFKSLVKRKIETIENISSSNNSYVDIMRDRLSQIYEETIQAVRLTHLQDPTNPHGGNGFRKAPLQTCWDLGTLQTILKPLLALLLNPPQGSAGPAGWQVANSSRQGYWLGDALFRTWRYFGLKEGASSDRLHHYPPSFFLEWAYPRSQDWRPVQRYPHGCPQSASDGALDARCTRGVLATTLHRMSDVVFYESFVLGQNPNNNVIPVLHDLKLYTKAWTDTDPNLIPEDLGIVAASNPLSLLQVAEAITTKRSTNNVLGMLHNQEWVGGLLHDSIDFLGALAGQGALSAQVHGMLFGSAGAATSPSPTSTALSTASVDSSSPGLLGNLFNGIAALSLPTVVSRLVGMPYSDFQKTVKFFVFNERPMASVLAENAPGYSSVGQNLEFAGVSYASGMEVLRDAIYELVRSTPTDKRDFLAAHRPENHLNFILTLAELGTFGMLAQFLQGEDSKERSLQDMFKGLVRLWIAPEDSAVNSPPALRGLLLALFPEGQKDSKNVEAFWSVLTPIFDFYQTGSAELWGHFRHFQRYALALLNVLEEVSEGTLSIMLKESAVLASKWSEKGPAVLHQKEVWSWALSRLESAGVFLEKLYAFVIEDAAQEKARAKQLAALLQVVFQPLKNEVGALSLASEMALLGKAIFASPDAFASFQQFCVAFDQLGKDLQEIHRLLKPLVTL